MDSRNSFCWASHSFSKSLDEKAAFYLMQWKESEYKEMSLFASRCSLNGPESFEHLKGDTSGPRELFSSE